MPVDSSRDDYVQYVEVHSDGAVISSTTALAQARDRLMQYIKANGLSVESCEWAADMTAYVDHKATGYIVEISGDKPGWIGIACYYKNNEAKFAFETGYDSHNAAQDAVFAAIRNESGSIASGYPMVFQSL
jgi:exonuclease III